MEKEFVIKPAGDSAVAVMFKNEISEEVNNQVAALRKSLERLAMQSITECLPTYRSIMVHYNPLMISYKKVVSVIEKCINDKQEQDKIVAKTYVIPVCYGGEYGPDIDTVATLNSLSQDEVVNIHTGVDYRIYMLGFTPGFPYLGGMDDAIATPRLTEPRMKIQGGSVGIAGKQTGIYPIDSPGGWQIIGRTPLRLFDVNNHTPILLEAGNYIRFQAIDQETFKLIEKQVELQTYKCKIISHEQGGV